MNPSRTLCCDLSSPTQLHHQPRALLRDGGRSRVWLVSQAITSSSGYITAPTHTFVIIHGCLCIMGRTGTAVLPTFNSTSSHSPQEGSEQKSANKQARLGTWKLRGALLKQISLLSAFAFFASPIELIF